jgi:hypothetical protein
LMFEATALTRFKPEGHWHQGIRCTVQYGATGSMILLTDSEAVLHCLYNAVQCG